MRQSGEGPLLLHPPTRATPEAVLDGRSAGNAGMSEDLTARIAREEVLGEAAEERWTVAAKVLVGLPHTPFLSRALGIPPAH